MDGDSDKREECAHTWAQRIRAGALRDAARDLRAAGPQPETDRPRGITWHGQEAAAIIADWLDGRADAIEGKR